MNLYSVNFRHHGQKSSHEGIVTLVLAKNDEQVFNFLETDGYGRGGDFIYNGAIIGIDADENPEEYKKAIIATRGSMYNEDAAYGDLYYGVLHTGWKLIEENCKTDYSHLIKLGVIVDISEK